MASGPPSTPRFCALLIDDFEHLKSLQAAKPNQPLPKLIQLQESFDPGLQAAAPPSIAAAVESWLGYGTKLDALLAQHGYDILAVPPNALKTISTGQSNAAAEAVSSFSSASCDFQIISGEG